MTPHKPAEPRSRPPERDRGSATLEFAILAPALLLLIFGIIQASLIVHARHVALAAASEGLAVATTLDATAGDGRAAANQLLARAGGPGVLDKTQISITRTRQEATVTVTGSAPRLIPGFHWNITQTATGPVERFTTRGQP
jgi:Flp pilus assembly protein TadG